MMIATTTRPPGTKSCSPLARKSPLSEEGEQRVLADVAAIAIICVLSAFSPTFTSTRLKEACLELLPSHGPPSRIIGIAPLVAVLLGFALPSQPSLADAADSKGGGTTISVVRGPTSDVREMPEVAPGGGVVLRGNRPVKPRQPALGQGDDPAANVGFTPRPFLGFGWDTGYDFNGLNYVPTPR